MSVGQGPNYMRKERKCTLDTEGGTQMYRNMMMIMGQKGISMEAMAVVLNIHRNTMANKISGKSEFTYEEASLLCQTFFPEYRLSYIFRRDTEDTSNRSV